MKIGGGYKQNESNSANWKKPMGEVLSMMSPALKASGAVVKRGAWLWAEFDNVPSQYEGELRALGFRKNHNRRAFQHSCGKWFRKSDSDPRLRYQAEDLSGQTISPLASQVQNTQSPRSNLSLF